jgi:hypothetical protein
VREYISLTELELEDSQKILKLSDKQLSKNLSIICNGEPLYLGLTDLYFNVLPNLPIPEFVFYKTKKIRDNIDYYRGEYEKMLLNIFLEPQIYGENREYIYQMAFFELRYDEKIMKFINEFQSIEEASEKLNKIKLGFFLKHRTGQVHVLHDVLRKIINEKIWPQIDEKEPKKRKKYSRQIREYYDKEMLRLENTISELEKINDIKSNYKKHILKQRIYAYNYEKFFYNSKYYTETIDHNLHSEISKNRENDIPAIDNIINIIKNRFNTANEDEKNSNNFIELEYQYTRYLGKKGGDNNRTEAIEILERLIEINKGFKTKDKKFKMIFYYQTLGYIHFEQDAIIEAKKYFEDADKLTESSELSDHKEIHSRKLYNKMNFGQLYTQEGDLEKAIENYNKALEIAFTQNKDVYEAYIDVLLGNVYRYRGDLIEAEYHYNKADSIFKDKNHKAGEYFTLIFKATLMSKKGFFKEAEKKFFEKIRRYAQDKNDDKLLAQCYNHWSRALFENFIIPNIGHKKGDFDKDREYLEKNLEMAKDSDVLCKKFQPHDLAVSLMNTGNTLLELAKIYMEKYENNEENKEDPNKLEKQAKSYFSQSIDTLNEALKLAEKNNDIRVICNTYTIIAEWNMEKGETSGIKNALTEMKKSPIKDKVFENYLGDIYYYLALDAIRKKDTPEKVLKYFRESLVFLPKPAELPLLNFQLYLNEITKYLLNQTKDIQKEWYEIFRINQDRPEILKREMVHLNFWLRDLNRKINN